MLDYLNKYNKYFVFLHSVTKQKEVDEDESSFFPKVFDHCAYIE